MEEIDLKDLFKYFLKRLWIIILVTLLFLGLGISYTIYLKKPLYKGDTDLILVNANDNANSNMPNQADILVNQKLITTYTELIKSKRVLNQVIKVLDLKLDYEELAKKITVSTVKESLIIKVRVSDENAKTAARIANTIANVFEQEVLDIYKSENVKIISEANIEKEPYNINIPKTGVIFAAIGFMLSCGIIFTIYYFDTSIKSVEEIENRLGVPVIGTVPKY